MEYWTQFQLPPRAGPGLLPQQLRKRPQPALVCHQFALTTRHEKDAKPASNVKSRCVVLTFSPCTADSGVEMKCDEESPKCRNCTKRGIECVWNNVNTLRHDSMPGTPTHAVASSLGNFPSTVSNLTSSGSFDVLTLELIHHFATTTSHTLSF